MSRARIVDAARAWRGTAYVHQSSTKGAGCDCLGLVRGVWRDVVGQEPYAVPPYTMDWSEAGSNEVLWRAADAFLQPVPASAALAPGQVLLFRMRAGAVAKHLGILTDTGDWPRFIHAFSGRGVIENSYSDAWARRVVARFDFPDT